MQDYESMEIFEAINKINNSIFLPDIQRNFVWRPEQIYTIFDSIMRDYPINTMLFWKQTGHDLQKNKIKKLKFVLSNEDDNTEDTSKSRDKDYFLVLDGQQRLTTFNIVLKGNYYIRRKPCDLYFNLESGDIENDDGILYEFAFFDKNRGECFVEKTADKKDSKNIKPKVWFSVKSIVDCVFETVQKTVENKLQKECKISITVNQLQSVNKLFFRLKHEKLIYYYPEKNADYDKVLDIFVRTNSGGTKLTHSDLLFSTIKSKIPSAKDDFQELIDTLNDGSRFDFNNDFILKTCLLLNAKNSESVRYNVGNLNENFFRFIKDNWKSIQKSITLVKDIIHDKFLITHDKVLTSYNALIPIIYYFHKNGIISYGAGKHSISDSELKNIRIWLIKTMLNGIFSAHSDTIIYKCKEIIGKGKTKSFPFDDIDKTLKTEHNRQNEIDFDRLDNIQYKGKNSYLVLSLIYNGQINFVPTSKNNLPEQDHIISKKELKGSSFSEKEINSIYNIRLVSSSENREKSGTNFKEWLDSQKNPKDICDLHLIQKGNWNKANFGKFIEMRKDLIKKKLTYIK